MPSSAQRYQGGGRITHQCRSHSQVIERALELLQLQELEAAYRDAAQEIDPVWDAVISDGLGDEEFPQ